ncbi:MAG TPA: hypothetical protein VJ842_12810 [Pyrinomonadaceae bacterium]|nr:hypothetical protein [Pyrinomonadaceae bacterium]
MRTARLTTLTLVISALLLTSSTQTFNHAVHAQNSSVPQSRMYCIGYGTPIQHLYRVDNYATTPTAVDLGEIGPRLTDIAITPSGIGYAITITGLYRIDLENGKTTLIRELFNRSQNSLEAASDNRLFTWGPGDTMIRSIDLTTLAVTPLVDPKKFGTDLALAPGGIDLYGTSLDGMLIKVNLVTLAVTTIGSLGIQTNPIVGLGFASDGQLYGTRGSNTTGLAQVYKINVCTGAATLVGDIAGASQLGNGGMAMRR